MTSNMRILKYDCVKISISTQYAGHNRLHKIEIPLCQIHEDALRWRQRQPKHQKAILNLRK